jgi:CPA1 family monovalent cation:H+ antiporter
MVTSVIEVSLVLLLLASFMAAVQARLKVPLELLMLVGSLGIAFVPGLPRVEVTPDMVFLLFLPPILFAAAYFTSWRDFKANRRAIGLLATGLVLFTSFAVAGVARFMNPTLSWPVAFALGAMVSPPDASAAAALTRKLRLPRRLVTILEGESLVNDATALVLYRVAIAATLTGSVSFHGAFFQFLYMGAGGVVMGYLIGRAGLWMLLRLPDAKAQTVLSLVTAFSAYVVAEAFHVSGVMSTVAAGLCFGRWLPLLANARTRVESRTSWDLLLFVINGFVFTMIGFQLPMIVRGLGAYSWRQLLLEAAAVNVTVFVVRFLWVYPATYVPRWIFPSIAKADPSPNWRPVAVLGWMGMRGIVSLAAALALPADFPNRALLLFLAYSVILVTLIVPPLTLPWVLKLLKIPEGNEHSREEAMARYAATKAALDHLNTPGGNGFTDDQLSVMRRRYERRLKTLEPNLQENAFSPVNPEDRQFRHLLQSTINWEREVLRDLRQNAKIHDEVFHTLSYELDLEELRLKTPRVS